MESFEKPLSIPSNYLTILEACGPKAVLAGGCLRDLLFEREVKDIDIFVQIGINNNEEIDKRLREISYIWGEFPVDHEEYKGSSFISASITYNGKSTPLNLVWVEEINDIPIKFDFGLNQIALIDGKVMVTDAFKTDAANSTFTLTWCENQERFDRCIRRFRRLWLKYPIFKLVIPPEFRQYQIQPMDAF